MAEIALSRMTMDEFLAWAETQSGRYELEDGKVLAISPERIRHAEAKGVVYGALAAACRRAAIGCRVLPDGATVRIDAGTAYEPDALIYRGPKLPGDRTEVPDPVVVVEVLSPSTAYRDVGAKLAGYFRLKSLLHYLIVDPDRPVLVHHARAENSLIMTRILSEGSIVMDRPGLTIDVSEMLFGDP